MEDIIPKNCKLLICGTALGNRSAERKQYYAGRGNKFWPTLVELGLILVSPEKENYDERVSAMKAAGIGLTDLVKKKTGGDKKLRPGDFDRQRLLDVINITKPKIVCFNGKTAAKVFFHTGLGYGEYITIWDRLLHKPIFFIATSTSSLAKSHWDPKSWKKLADIFQKLQF